MEPEEDNQLIRQLAYEWVQVGLPSHRSTYSDYLRFMATLQSVTDDRNRTRAIFRAVLDQATRLGKSSEWVETELKFEALAESLSNRASLLLLDLEYRLPVSDASLDLYNERLTRFNANG